MHQRADEIELLHVHGQFYINFQFMITEYTHRLWKDNILGSSDWKETQGNNAGVDFAQLCVVVCMIDLQFE